MMRRSRAFLTLLIVAACGLTGVAGQQRPQQNQPQQPQAPVATFRSSTKLVVQTVTVKDKDGKPVEGLTAKDFTLTEDGEAQDIAFVEFQQLRTGPSEAPVTPQFKAVTPASGTAAEPTTQSQISAPAGGGIKYQDRRLLVFYFDTASMMPADALRAYSNGLKYIEDQMTASDLLAIIAFQNGAIRVKTDFTDDRNALKEIINVLIYGDDQNNDGIPDNPDGGTAFGQDGGEFNVFNTDRQLAALQTAVTMLRVLPEQKSLIYFGSGLRLNGANNQAQLAATTNAAVRANTTINPIDARGLVAFAPLGDATQRSPGGIGMFTGTLAMNVTNNFQRSQDTLYALAKDTGGKAMFDYNDLSLGIKQAAETLTSYYIIGYYSTHTATDGKFRRVKVSLTSNQVADLTFRQGYYADKSYANFNNADKDRQLEEALMQADPVTEMTMAMELNYFRLNRAEYFIPVDVKIPGTEVALAKRRGATRTLIDFIGEVKDDHGYTHQNLRDKLDIKLDADEVAALASRPIQIQIGFTLLPGKYVIKLLARDSVTGRIGTFQSDFTVPNLDKEAQRVPISTVVLSSQRVRVGDELYSVKNKTGEAAVLANPMIAEGQRLSPSVTRVFSRTKDMYVFLQAYEQAATTTQPLVAFVTFYRGDAKAFETAPLTVIDGLEPRSKAVPLRFSVPLETITPGRYECQVTVLDPASQKAAFWRAPIVVIP